MVHDRYKDLASVEQAFRTCKTVHLEVRPIFLRLEARTRAHAFVVMLAYPDSTGFSGKIPTS
jgi:transposase